MEENVDGPIPHSKSTLLQSNIILNQNNGLSNGSLSTSAKLKRTKSVPISKRPTSKQLKSRKVTLLYTNDL